MSEACEILVTTFNEGQVVAGKITLEKGKLKATSNKGYEDLIKNIRTSNTLVKGKELDSKKNPEAWLHSLPSFYTGMHLRARLVE